MRASDKEAAQDEMVTWFRRCGSLPSCQEWDAAHKRPCVRTIARRWNWNALRADALGIATAELRNLAGFHGRQWTTHSAVLALRLWRATHGRIPTFGDWEHAADSHPASRTVSRLFGDWRAGLSAAYPDLHVESRNGRNHS